MEINPILEKLKSVDRGIKLSYVVVSKRINTRFFRQTGPEKFTNPEAGTVVDNRVVKLHSLRVK